MTYDDYGHINPDPKVAALTHEIGPKSVITFPSGGQQLPGPGFYEITGLAWSGAGAVRKSGDIHATAARPGTRPSFDRRLCRWRTRDLACMEVGRQGVRADVALHRRTRHGAADARRGREVLESSPRQQFPRAGRGQQRPTVESRGDGSVHNGLA